MPSSIYDLATSYDVNSPALQLRALPARTEAEPQVGGLEAMLGRYAPQGDEYAGELRTARENLSRETQAFEALLKSAAERAPGGDGPSQAEMYFRLAAAFGSPTRTGHFTESLGAAGAAAADILKERREADRAARTQSRQLGLEAQKARMTGAREDVTTLRQLAAEGMKDKRQIAAELIRDYVKSGQPQSAAGRQAADEGLKPGTPEFQRRVEQIAEAGIEAQMARVNATLAGMSVTQANLALAQQRFGFQKEQAGKLTPGEMTLKTSTEDSLAQVSQAMADLKRAYALNPNTFDASAVDRAQYEVLSRAGSKDPKVVATGELTNLLQKAALGQLKTTFPGQISNEERKALMDVQGLGSRSIKEREVIMRNAYKALQSVQSRTQMRLNDINAGRYRDTTPAAGLGED